MFVDSKVGDLLLIHILAQSVQSNNVSEELLLELGMKLLVVDKVLDHAEVKQFTDERVKRWLVRVKNDFCLLKVTKSILEGIRSATSSDMQSENLDLLQQKLKESLGDNRFLLVLDDVWEKCPRSKVVVTTRNRNVAKIMRADHTHPLEGLSQAHCWSLFQKLAFEDGDSSPYSQLESIGKKIVAKCQGLPLAVKALGSLLYSKTDRREWEQILESEIWGLQHHQILSLVDIELSRSPIASETMFCLLLHFPQGP
ncbi:unnamed protein product, partial [Vitis vinifera]